jgi:hypothetical protein
VHVRICMHKAYSHGDCCEAMHVCACLCVYEQDVCSRQLLQGDTCMCMCVDMNKAYVPCDCCEAVHVRICMHKVYSHGDCCEAMHVCACLCVHMNEAYAHGDCCKAMRCMCRSVFLDK